MRSDRIWRMWRGHKVWIVRQDSGAFGTTPDFTRASEFDPEESAALVRLLNAQSHEERGPWAAEY
jgi:hypothetical protein